MPLALSKQSLANVIINMAMPISHSSPPKRYHASEEPAACQAFPLHGAPFPGWQGPSAGSSCYSFFGSSCPSCTGLKEPGLGQTLTLSLSLSLSRPKPHLEPLARAACLPGPLLGADLIDSRAHSRGPTLAQLRVERFLFFFAQWPELTPSGGGRVACQCHIGGLQWFLHVCRPGARLNTEVGWWHAAHDIFHYDVGCSSDICVRQLRGPQAPKLEIHADQTIWAPSS